MSDRNRFYFDVLQIRGRRSTLDLVMVFCMAGAVNRELWACGSFSQLSRESFFCIMNVSLEMHLLRNASASVHWQGCVMSILMCRFPGRRGAL